MPLSSGTKLGPYEILAAAGAGGGMGEVYRTRDTRLDRIVAIKILPDGFAADTGRLRRFQQESQSVASSGGNDRDLVGLDGTTTPFLNGPASETDGQISPDGKWAI